MIPYEETAADLAQLLPPDRRAHAAALLEIIEAIQRLDSTLQRIARVLEKHDPDAWKERLPW